MIQSWSVVSSDHSIIQTWSWRSWAFWNLWKAWDSKCKNKQGAKLSKNDPKKHGNKAAKWTATPRCGGAGDSGATGDPKGPGASKAGALSPTGAQLESIPLYSTTYSHYIYYMPIIFPLFSGQPSLFWHRNIRNIECSKLATSLILHDLNDLETLSVTMCKHCQCLAPATAHSKHIRRSLEAQVFASLWPGSINYLFSGSEMVYHILKPEIFTTNAMGTSFQTHQDGSFPTTQKRNHHHQQRYQWYVLIPMSTWFGIISQYVIMRFASIHQICYSFICVIMHHYEPLQSIT